MLVEISASRNLQLSTASFACTGRGWYAENPEGGLVLSHPVDPDLTKPIFCSWSVTYHFKPAKLSGPAFQQTLFFPRNMLDSRLFFYFFGPMIALGFLARAKVVKLCGCGRPFRLSGPQPFGHGPRR